MNSWQFYLWSPGINFFRLLSWFWVSLGIVALFGVWFSSNWWTLCWEQMAALPRHWPTRWKSLCSVRINIGRINIGRRINIRINMRKGWERLCPCPPPMPPVSTLLSSGFQYLNFKFVSSSACFVPPQNASAATDSIYSEFKWGARMCFLRVPPAQDFNIQISAIGQLLD